MAGLGRWRRQLPEISALCDEWLSSVTVREMGENRVTVEVEPATEPPAGALWNWWMTFSCGDREISAVVSEDLGKMLFEDRAGRFEDEVPVRDVVRYLIGRFVG